MSRCFPYTRPIYKREDVSLIGSIKKLQIQWVNTKPRKQVSMKVNEKQSKKRSREDHDRLDSLQHKNKKRKADKNFKYIESFPYASKGDSDHLERSDLSEEHDPPALVLSQCNSSKCAQSNNKKNAVQDSDSVKKKQGMVIRIKLPLKKNEEHVEPESASTDPYRTSQFTPSFFTDAAPSCSSQVSKPSKVQALLTEPVAQASSEPRFSVPVFAEPNRGRRSERHLFRDLVQNWKLPSIQPIPADEDEPDWLYSKTGSGSRICEAGISDAAATCPSSGSASSLQPRAAYLPELAMYQMPYVIPF